MGKKFKFWFLGLFGYKYLLNLRSNEVHDIKINHKNCHLFDISNYDLITKKDAMKLFSKTEANGCFFCMRKFDTDKPKKNAIKKRVIK